jgi:hypothetical protein
MVAVELVRENVTMKCEKSKTRFRETKLHNNTEQVMDFM